MHSYLFFSLQETVELRQTVMEENEELKSKLLQCQELKSEQNCKIVNLEKEYSNLEKQATEYENMVRTSIFLFLKRLTVMQIMSRFSFG